MLRRIERRRAEIDMAHIRADGNIGGLIFAAGTAVIFLIGIPAIRQMFAVALVLGILIAFLLRYVRYETREPASLGTELNKKAV